MKTIRKLFTYIKNYKLLLLISIVFSIISVFCLLYVSVLIGECIDCIIGVNNVDFTTLYKILLKFIITVLGYSLNQYFMNLSSTLLSYKVIKDIREKAFQNLLELPLNYYDTTPHGDIIVRLINDCELTSSGLIQGFNQLSTGIFTIIFTLVVMFLLNTTLTIIVILITPLSLIIAFIIARGTFSKFQNTALVNAKLTSYIEEMVINQKIIKTYAYEKRSIEKFDNINEELKKVSFLSVIYPALVNPFTRFINGIMYAIVGGVGAILIIKNPTIAFSVGQLSTFLFYATQYTKPFNEISGVISEFQSALASCERVFILIDQEKEKEETDLLSLDNNTYSVEFKDVSFSYTKEKMIINNFNFNVKSGQKVAIVGKTGSGKTTLINLLMRFYEYSSGKISINNIEIKEIKKDNIRNLFGMVLQDVWIFNGTIKENICYGSEDIEFDKILEVCKKINIYNTIIKLKNGFDTQITNASFSIGEFQLISIARVMLKNPPMLILDEATSSIDTLTEILIQKAFHLLMENKTTFIIAHRLQTIVESDLIVVIDGGKIIEIGNHQELMKNKNYYYELFKSQFES